MSTTSRRCRIGWHKKPYKALGFDGCSFHAQCTRCGFTGLVDSQGNLF